MSDYINARPHCTDDEMRVYVCDSLKAIQMELKPYIVSNATQNQIFKCDYIWDNFTEIAELIIGKCETFSEQTKIEWIDFGLSELKIEKSVCQWFMSFMLPIIESCVNETVNVKEIKGFVLREQSSDCSDSSDSKKGGTFHHYISDIGCQTMVVCLACTAMNQSGPLIFVWEASLKVAHCSFMWIQIEKIKRNLSCLILLVPCLCFLAILLFPAGCLITNLLVGASWALHQCVNFVSCTNV